MRETNLSRIPISTYRLQLNRSFPFAEAQRLAPYLKSLGITEYYCSSFLAARSGSIHGYDLCDHSRINPELGGREAFQNFSADYDDAVSKFMERTLTGRNSRVFLPLFLPFQERIASIGMVNSLSQLILKIGSPGVPDFYQGSELWDLNLVDPDSRRPVDFGLREQYLESIQPLLDQRGEAAAQIQAIQNMLNFWQDGRIKLFSTAAALRTRRRRLPHRSRDLARRTHTLAGELG